MIFLLTNWKTVLVLLIVLPLLGVALYLHHENTLLQTYVLQLQGEVAVAQTNITSLQAGMRAANTALEQARQVADERLAKSRAAVQAFRAQAPAEAQAVRAVQVAPVTDNACADAQAILSSYLTQVTK